jgi:hypothetical protein
MGLGDREVKTNLEKTQSLLAFCVTWVMGVGGVVRLGCVTKPMITSARVCVVYLRERERPGIEGAQVSQTAPRKY